MVEIASCYHQKLQKEPEMSNERKVAIEEMLGSIEVELNSKEREYVKEKTTKKQQVKKSLKESQNGKSPGLDGLTYEFWKSWMKEKDKDVNICKWLTMVI